MTPASTNASGQELRRGAVSWPQIAVLSIAGCGPASAMALNLQFMSQFAGAALVLAFVLAWPGLLFLINTFVQFARRVDSAGGLYTWNSKAWGPHVGFVYGWTFVGSYMVLSAAGFTIFGGWISQWLNDQYGVAIPWWVFSSLSLAYVAYLAYRGIVESMKLSLALLAFELVVLLALAGQVFISGPSDGSSVLSFVPFSVADSGTNFGGVILAMTFAVLGYVGLEEGTTLGAEASNPRRTVPIGLIVAASVVPIFYIVISYAVVYGYGINRMDDFGADPSPLQTVAQMYWGEVGLAVIVVASVVSVLAFSQSVFIAGARILYAMGKARVLPSILARVSARQTPQYGVLCMVVATILLGYPFALWLGVFTLWGYYGYLISIAFLVSYIMTNLGLIRFVWKRGEMSVIRHVIPAILGVVVFAYPLYKTVWPPQAGVYAYLPYIYLGWIALGAAVMIYLHRTNPEAIREADTILSEPRRVSDDAV